jgi:hypothetical protein
MTKNVEDVFRAWGIAMSNNLKSGSTVAADPGFDP